MNTINGGPTFHHFMPLCLNSNGGLYHQHSSMRTASLEKCPHKNSGPESIQVLNRTTRALNEKAEKQSIAILFGPEKTGLTNSEIDCCNHLIEIPSSESYSSLNLAAAVQVIAYELRINDKTIKERVMDRDLASNEEMELFYSHLNDVLLETGFLNPRNPRQLMRRLRVLFNRAELDENEMNIMRGILASFQSTSNKKP